MKLHIGDKIREIAEGKRIGPTEFGKMINTSKQNIYGIYKRKSVDSELLKKISNALDHNFFRYYLDEISQVTEEGVEYESSKDTIKILKQQLKECKKEKDWLKGVIDSLRNQ